MKKTLLMLIVMVMVLIGHGQTLTPEVIATGGNFLTQGEVSLSSTLGEPLIETSIGTSHYCISMRNSRRVDS